MSNAQLPLYNFYFRQLVDAPTLDGFQGSMIGAARGVLEGLVASSVLSGLDIAPSGATLAVTAASGIASSPSGYLGVIASTQLVTLATADATNPRRDLIVMRPNQVDSAFAPLPTAPLDNVPYQELQEAIVTVITGTPAASPVYPAALANDTVLAGVRVAPSATSVAQTDIDFEVRDIPGKHTRLQQNVGKYDDRCRPFVSTSQLLGIKPSQLSGPSKPEAFLYVAANIAAVFPLASGAFILSDTFLNFQSGAITGGDTTSSSFSPTIPTAGNCVVATVSLDATSLLHVSYGTVGTRAQCFAAIQNQSQSGAGAISIPSSQFLIAFVVVSSKDGSNVTELDSVDARSTFCFPNQITFNFFGDGSDGNATITTNNATSGPLSSGALTRDAYYNNLTISGSGAIFNNGFKIFVAGTLDLSNAGAGAIRCSGNNGSGSSGGGALTANTLGGSAAGGPGNGSSASGTSVGGSVTPANGGSGGFGGGVAGEGMINGYGGDSSLPTIMHVASLEILRGASLISGGAGGGGGLTGTSGGGSGGGSGGAVLFLAANIINRGASTAASAIKATGGAAGTATRTGSDATAGSGGGGGGGGFIYVVYAKLVGVQTTNNAVEANGGNGSNGANGGTTGGNGGCGGDGGTIILLPLNGAGTVVVGGKTGGGGSGDPDVGGTIHSGATGGTAAAPGTCVSKL